MACLAYEQISPTPLRGVSQNLPQHVADSTCQINKSDKHKSHEEVVLGGIIFTWHSASCVTCFCGHFRGRCRAAQPKRSGASLTLNIDLSSSARTRSSLIILLRISLVGDLDHDVYAPRVLACVLALDSQFGLGGQGVEDEVVVAMRAVFVAMPVSLILFQNM